MATNLKRQRPPGPPTSESGHASSLSLPRDHPIHAYLDDTKALVDLLADDLDLISCRELAFLRKFIKDTTDVVMSDDSDAHEYEGVRCDEEGKSVPGQLSDNEDASLLSNGSEQDNNDDEAGYWDDDGSPDEYQWSPTTDQKSVHKTPLPVTDKSDGDFETYECVVVGGGAAGVGVSVALLAGGMKRSNLLVLEKDIVGHSFDSWHADTRFISPSWYSNPFGPIDLNAVDPFSSVVGVCGATPKNVRDGPRLELDSCLGTQHPSGAEYASYLRGVASHWKIPVRESSNVISVRKIKGTDAWPVGGFEIKTECLSNGEVLGADDSHARRSVKQKTIYSRFIIWCGGEWSYPKAPEMNSSVIEETASFEAEAFVHYAHLGGGEVELESLVQRANANPVPLNLSKVSQGEGAGHAVIIGAYEAGIDMACTLLKRGIEHVTLVDSADHIQGWDTRSLDDDNAFAFNPDPSVALSPISARRLKLAQSTGRLTLLPSCKCVGVSTSAGDTPEGALSFCAKIVRVGSPTQSNNEAAGVAETLTASIPVILCTGFDVFQCKPMKELVGWNKNGSPVLSQSCDESIITPGFFICGPMLRHWMRRESPGLGGDICASVCVEDTSNIANADEKLVDMPRPLEIQNPEEEVIFCFIYKFRSRFALVAGEIISRLIYEDHCSFPMEDGANVAIDKVGNIRLEKLEKLLAVYKERGMLLSEMSCSMSSCAVGPNRPC